MFATLGNSYDISGSFADATTRNYGNFAVLIKDFLQILAQPTGSDTSINFSLDDNPASNNVDCPTETQQSRHLSLAATCLGHGESTEFVFYLSG
jgi:hypothetical protein